MRKKFVVAKAETEMLAWTNIKETDVSAHPILVEYWQEGAGWTWINADNIAESATKYAWSAAFISYVMRSEYSNFPKSASHSKYVIWARDRRTAGQTSQIAYEIDEYKPVPGDIVIKKRGYNGDLAGLYEGAKTHGDIVIENNGDYLTVIGGNLSNTVRETIVPATNGYIDNSDWFAVIKM